MGAQGIPARVVLRQHEGDGPSLETFVMKALPGDIAGVLVTRESDGDERLICGDAMHVFLDQYVVMKEIGMRAPDGVLWCDARDTDDGMAKAILSLFILDGERIDFTGLDALEKELAEMDDVDDLDPDLLEDED